MAQIFHPSTNTLSKISILAVLVGGGVLTAILVGLNWSDYVTKVRVPLEQPVPFSHEHHVNELGIDCRYCHTSVEKSAFAGLPPTETCMSCHSQIWTNSPLLEPVRESYRTGQPLKWYLVNNVPDFVYFNHSIHVNRGINCNNCHGPVQTMQMTYKGNAFHMGWCLQCHRNPEKYVQPREAVWDLYAKIQRGEKNLTPREQSLAAGKQYAAHTKEELELGEKLVKQYGIKKAQLSDCSVCHR